ncbi:serine hydrolase domain-containing protein [Nonomuraea typhae]|uniref:serine hydrolase domain-containing protein n=1 Tax=Nonomuraea typhae TaxID=2603600 RepID=UPI0012FA605B|nr:serine hydrolase domain-containing protein [Nonomuraea typhae]
MEEMLARLGITGAQVAVLDGNGLRETAYGTANAELGLPMTTDTLIQAGSTTKLCTAALAMILVGEGLLDLDAPVREHLPELRVAHGDRVTLRHLLSMTAGIDNGFYDDPADYLATLSDLEPLFEPGEGYSYSNASTVIAGTLAARRAGTSWDLALRERVLEPLGLRHSVTLQEELPYHRVAVGHGPDGAVVRPWTFSRASGPAGSTLCTTAGDLARFGEAFLRGPVLPAKVRQAMQEPQVTLPTRRFAEQWCLGPYRRRLGNLVVHGHSGTNLGGSSTLVWTEDTVVAVICNSPHAGYPLAAAVIEEVLGTGFHDVRPDGRPVEDATPYVGFYAACDMRYEVSAAGGELLLTLRDPASGEAGPPVRLLPLEGDRFLPEQDLSGGRGWDLAFVVRDGRAVRLVNGAFAARRYERETRSAS